MSKQYDLYLEEHKNNVAKGFYWIRENLPELLVPLPDVDYEWQICRNHDASKTEQDEYEAYDAYFYGGNRSYMVVQNFRYAWLNHIHRNPHHWQHWVLINDDPNEGEIIMEMPYNYAIEMICDYMSFGFRSGNHYEIFDWYDKHKDYMKLGVHTRGTVENILNKIKEKLDEINNAEE